MKNPRYSHGEDLRKGYKKLNEKISKVDVYTENETIQKLKSNTFHYTKWFGKSGNRKLIIADINLYKSILHYTEHYPHAINFRGRLMLLVKYDNNLNNIKCKCGNILKYNANNKSFTFTCKKCMPTPNSFYFYELQYGKELGLKKYNKMKAKAKIKLCGHQNKEWFIKRYGDDGEDAYKKHYEKIMKTREERGVVSYSKISQELFWMILAELTEKEKEEADIRFYTYDEKREQRINLSKEDNKILKETNRVTMFIDFKFNNKFIEFDGTYWHKGKEDIDRRRDIVLKNKGYEILHVPEAEFKKGKHEVVEECVNYLRL